MTQQPGVLRHPDTGAGSSSSSHLLGELSLRRARFRVPYSRKRGNRQPSGLEDPHDLIELLQATRVDEDEYPQSLPAIEKFAISQDKSWEKYSRPISDSDLWELGLERTARDEERFGEFVSPASTQKGRHFLVTVRIQFSDFIRQTSPSLIEIAQFRQYWAHLGHGATKKRVPAFSESGQAVEYLKASDLIAEGEGLETFLDELKEEDESPVIDMTSLQSAVRFIETSGFPNPSWDVDHEGRVSLSWIVPPYAHDLDRECWEDSGGIIGLKFLPTGRIQFAALSGPHERGKERLKLSGTLSLAKVREVFNVFAPWMVNSAKISVI